MEIWPATSFSETALIGIGPVSRNTVDACISMARKLPTPLMLIPSRRQVEMTEMGGGYVEGWSTDRFARYVRKRDPARLVRICRDHGGPYQHPSELVQQLSPSAAMNSALASFAEDIRCGFDLLHLDTSADRSGAASQQDALNRLIDLYRECYSAARAAERHVEFEIGLEEQSRDFSDPAEFQDQLALILGRLRAEGLPMPTFAVSQTGTKVVETRNAGALRNSSSNAIPILRSLADCTRKFCVRLKAHNADYLDSTSIHSLAAGGVSAVNVAPELGVTETREFIRLLDILALRAERDDFLELSYNSLAWRKWMADDSITTDYERAIIAGHYVFGTNQFGEIKKACLSAARRAGIDIDHCLQLAISRIIRRYAAVLSQAG